MVEFKHTDYTTAKGVLVAVCPGLQMGQVDVVVLLQLAVVDRHQRQQLIRIGLPQTRLHREVAGPTSPLSKYITSL